MQNEFEALRVKYMAIDFGIFCGNKELCESDLNSFMDLYKSAVQFDRPDMYAIQDNDVLIIEHFEFDSTTQNKSGSEYRRGLAQVDRDIEKFNSQPTVSINGDILNEKIKCTHSVKQYYDNFNEVFTDHYSEIDDYINNLRGVGVITDVTKNKTCFIIEDVSMLGNMYIDKSNDELYVLNLFFCKQFLDIFERSTKLDFILFGFYDASKHTYALCFITHKTIDFFRKNEIDLDNIEIIDFDLYTTGYKTEIHNKKDESV